MRFSFGPRIRHPFFPGLTPTPAEGAKELCSALYGTFQELVRAADAGVHARRAVFVTRREEEPPLSDADRDVLWRIYQVPAFVLLLDQKNRLLAYECEAQNGLHVTPKYAVRAVSEACACGRPGDRVLLTVA